MPGWRDDCAESACERRAVIGAAEGCGRSLAMLRNIWIPKLAHARAQIADGRSGFMPRGSKSRGKPAPTGRRCAGLRNRGVNPLLPGRRCAGLRNRGVNPLLPERLHWPGFVRGDTETSAFARLAAAGPNFGIQVIRTFELGRLEVGETSLVQSQINQFAQGLNGPHSPARRRASRRMAGET